MRARFIFSVHPTAANATACFQTPSSQNMIRNNKNNLRIASPFDYVEDPGWAVSSWPRRKRDRLRYYLARQAARLGAIELATSLLLQSFEEGYWCTTGLRLDPWLESLRTTTQFCRIYEMVEKREAQSRAAFVNAGGERTLHEELHAGKDEYRGAVNEFAPGSGLTGLDP
jgi:hypothetical protein